MTCAGPIIVTVAIVIVATGAVNSIVVDNVVQYKNTKPNQLNHLTKYCDGKYRALVYAYLPDYSYMQHQLRSSHCLGTSLSPRHSWCHGCQKCCRESGQSQLPHSCSWLRNPVWRNREGSSLVSPTVTRNAHNALNM